jgi:hypothetical protein
MGSHVTECRSMHLPTCHACYQRSVVCHLSLFLLCLKGTLAPWRQIVCKGRPSNEHLQLCMFQQCWSDSASSWVSLCWCHRSSN